MSNKIEFHPEAKTDFNKKANQLVTKLEVQGDDKEAKKPKFKTQDHISHTFTDKDIVSINSYRMVDGFGNLQPESFVFNNQVIAFSPEQHTEHLKLAEAMHKVPIVNSMLTFDYVCDTVFTWLKLKYINKNDTDMIEYFLKESESEIDNYEFWMPVAHLYLESDINIGRVTLSTLQKFTIDKWEAHGLSKQPELETQIKSYYNTLRSQLQGKAIAKCTVSGELKRAKKMAFREAEVSTSILRIYSTAMQIAEVKSYCTLLGSENLETESYFYFNSGLSLPSICKNIKKKGTFDWKIDNEFIKLMLLEGLSNINYLLKNIEKTPFENKLLDSLYLYSKSAVQNNMSDKILYMIISVEALLLKNETESIIQNISERIAFFIKKTKIDRKKVIKNVKAVYNLRSKLVHHGTSIDETDKLNIFIRYIWDFYISLIKLHKNFKTKEEFIQSIDDIKLS